MAAGDTPEDDAGYFGWDGHLDRARPHDVLYMFFRSASGGWDFKSSNENPGNWTCA